MRVGDVGVHGWRAWLDLPRGMGASGDWGRNIREVYKK